MTGLTKNEIQILIDAANSPLLTRIRVLEKDMARLNHHGPRPGHSHTEHIESPNGSHGTLHIADDEPER